MRPLLPRVLFCLEVPFFAPQRSLHVNSKFFRGDAEGGCDLPGAGGHVQSTFSQCHLQARLATCVKPGVLAVDIGLLDEPHRFNASDDVLGPADVQQQGPRSR